MLTRQGGGLQLVQAGNGGKMGWWWGVHINSNYLYYFHTPKCTFNPNPIWYEKWNYMNP